MANILEQLRKLLPSSLFPKPGAGSVVGVDIGSAFVKVVELGAKGGKATLKTYGESALGPVAGFEVGQATNLPAEKLAEVIIGLFREANVVSRDISFSIPLTSTLLTVIEMPDVDADQLKEMIPLEARKYIPTAITEVSLSHWIIPKSNAVYVDPDAEAKNKNAPPKVEVLLAVVHNDVIAKYNDIAKRIGATGVSFEIETFSTIRAVLGRDNAPSMLIDIGAANTKVALIEEGVVRSSHLINSGSQDITSALARAKGISVVEAEEIKQTFGLFGDPNDPSVAEIVRLAADRMFAEASRIFEKYQRERRVAIGKVVLAGGGSLMKGVPELVSNGFGVSAVYGNAFGSVEAPAAILPLLKEAGPEFAVAAGLALRKFV
ncbi:MAG: hypothetical protein A3C93_02810 [Candidatus Lloydbacteria bacterium RIFCSPHIGHO2_02_FULL_54_17]|uniref:SHS2 domain-containing protein n=1 Tax=Candidatus Lloydbacteria bacterium RIFCSPHIGHO2_02_FULL_54_17 TaxID=1798664 RepID=A0A1G2DDK9_9BACT|nr:MAG: hypothetical protein A2762_06065 [Candidatus Lloydbacteria bacterium RIFCSPHIGHO2_01_FULL_54_11]OGZ10950.1 MAG: hypothetical protein A3C93_02810 [Candidatus Lloydbacteria bacterium RIFCSPHIGHO2_02_FULL_54_17]OGZ14930.1 MAG: hypothetical protein A2948_05405 [Candidatus Lloydbacteria bacterium RIFCSPLOWO2_01_FULL_54_18]OGZ17157.1 MAG: hypothetical protein A3H76_04055 [Candidatus Lloydbacteria bacterium RIFCSPLOWO2_02_FULL_54_12]